MSGPASRLRTFWVSAIFARGRGTAGPAAVFIKHDDERPGQRYIGPQYPQGSRRSRPQSNRRERRVASALRRRIDLMFADLICRPTGMDGRPCRTVPAAIGPA
jgi:hypothetical protein